MHTQILGYRGWASRFIEDRESTMLLTTIVVGPIRLEKNGHLSFWVSFRRLTVVAYAGKSSLTGVFCVILVAAERSPFLSNPGCLFDH